MPTYPNTRKNPESISLRKMGKKERKEDGRSCLPIDGVFTLSENVTKRVARATIISKDQEKSKGKLSRSSTHASPKESKTAETNARPILNLELMGEARLMMRTGCSYSLAKHEGGGDLEQETEEGTFG